MTLFPPSPMPVEMRLTFCPATQGPMGGALAELSSEGLAWLPTVANLITLSCFGLSLLLNIYLTQVSNTLSNCPLITDLGSIYADALPQTSSEPG